VPPNKVAFACAKFHPSSRAQSATVTDLLRINGEVIQEMAARLVRTQSLGSVARAQERPATAHDVVWSYCPRCNPTVCSPRLVTTRCCTERQRGACAALSLICRCRFTIECPGMYRGCCPPQGPGGVDENECEYRMAARIGFTVFSDRGRDTPYSGGWDMRE